MIVLDGRSWFTAVTSQRRHVRMRELVESPQFRLGCLLKITEQVAASGTVLRYGTDRAPQVPGAHEPQDSGL